MRRLILGTAGHIDHGKTRLVQALTGVDTDRLPEEKRRGITIDLGFARLPLDDELELGVVDVPGHEGFVRNMLAGATGFDLALLVVAADEGVMPQTREHLAIIELLGVRAGVVALTKTDLVEPDWLRLVLDDVQTQLAGSAFAGAPIVPVSAVTGRGLDELRAALHAAALTARERSDDDLFRLPVDRVFTVHGTGTVVTGTVWSGRVRTDDPLRLLPGDLAVRARALQVHGADVPAATAGQRAAVALAGTPRERVARGTVLVGEGGWQAASLLTTRLHLIAGTGRELKQRQRVRFHLGTAELLGRVRLLDAERLGPAGGADAVVDAWAQIALEAPVVARAGDRFVLRSYSPVTTIGGGVVHEPAAPRRRRLHPGEAERMEQLLGPPATALEARAELAGWTGAERGRLAVETPHGPAALDRALQASAAEPSGPRLIGERVFAAGIVRAGREALLAAVDRHHAEQPLRPGIEREELRRALPGAAAPGLADALLEALLQDGTLSAGGERGRAIARAGFTPRLDAPQAEARARLLTLFEEAGLAPPSLAELPAELRRRPDFWPLLRLLEGEGRLLAMAPESFVAARAIEDARRLLRERLGPDRPLAPADFKQLFALTRKHLIPLLEYLDRTGVTVRRGNDRYLAVP